METTGKFNLNKSKKKSISNISLNHEKIRLNKKIITLEEQLNLNNEQLNKSQDENSSLNEQLIILAERYNKCLNENKIFVNNINRNQSELTKYRLEDKNHNEIIENYNIKIKELEININNLLKETEDNIKIKSNIFSNIKSKKEIILPSLIRNFKNKIINILSILNKYYKTWLQIFINDWNGDNTNIFSLGSNRTLEILKKFGYNTIFLKNNIPNKIIEEPINGWKISDKESLNYIIKDYIYFSNILLKSCPGCDNFVINKNINISIKTLFDAVSICTPENYDSNIDQLQLLNSNYSNAKFWSNYKDIIDKTIICSKNIVTINNIIDNLSIINDNITKLLDNIENNFQNIIIETSNYIKIESIWETILNDYKNIYTIISDELLKLSNNNYLKDHIFIQVDFIKLIDKNNIIQWIREIPLLYTDSINGPNVFQEYNSYNVTKYLITNIDGNINSKENETYQLAGDYANLFKDESNQQINKIPIHDRFEVIKSSDEYRTEILNKDVFDISKINILFDNISNEYNKLKNLFLTDFEYINM